MADGSKSKLGQNKEIKKVNNIVRKGQENRILKDNVIYISSKTNIQYIIQKCEKLLKNDQKEIIFYCMGSAIQRGILAALKLCDEHPSLTHFVNTYTTRINELVVPSTDEEEFETLTRNNSTVCIRLIQNKLPETTDNL